MRELDALEDGAERLETPCGEGVMVWRRWNAAAGAPMVMLHGGSGSWLHWTRQIPTFAARRTLLVPDLPGLGESADPPGGSSPDAAATIVADGLRRLVPDTRMADLVGFSWGANIAGHVAAELDGALRSLTLLGSGGLGTPRNPVPLEKVRDKEGAARVAAHRHNLASLMIADPARVDDLALEIQERAFINSRLRSRQFATKALLRDALARTPGLPLNAIWGERDALAWPNLQERLDVLRAVRPDGRIVVIPGAGHWVAYEAPTQVNALLLDWLREDR